MKMPALWNVSVLPPTLLKRFALIYLPIVMVLSVVLLSVIRLDEQTRMERREARENSRIEIARELVARDFSSVNTDLRVIANSPLLRRYLDSRDPVQRKELEEVFLVLVWESRLYDQVRYLDASGQEVIRINYNNGNPIIVPLDQLQNKSDRYYFRDTIKLNRGETFVSQLDLNIERGSLEIPHKPMIRFGTPVFDSAGRKQGVVVFNYFGDQLLQSFREVMRGGDPRIGMLLNRDGYWLSSTRHEDEWGFMLDKKERTFGHDFVEEWRAISAAEQGVLLTDRGLFVYTTVYPLLLGQHSSTVSAMAQHAPGPHDVAHEYQWKIVSFVPHAILSGTALYNQPIGRIMLAFIYLLLALAAFVIARISLAREHINAERNRLLRILEDATDYIGMSDMQGRLQFHNVAARRMLGFPDDADLSSMEIKDMHPEWAGRLVMEEGIPALLLQDFWQSENALLHRDGHEIPVSQSLRLHRDASGNPEFISTIMRDITERKRAEQLLRAKNDELKAFAYTVSHDLKAPLRGITGYAQELERRHKEGLAERAQFCIAQIITASKNLDNLIEDLLKYSRIDTETPTLTEVNLSSLVQGILRDRSLVITEQSVEVSVEVQPVMLHSWERGLQQVLANLIDNAIKYSRHSQPPRLTIRAEATNGICRITVTDNGIGFDMKYHDRIFGLFNRLVRADEFEGTGAGLAIVKKLVDKLGGSIRAESAPGQGATFFVELPISSAGESAP